MKRIKQIFSVLAFLWLCVNSYAQGKNVTWKSMKPLDAFGERPVAIANSDSKNKAFAVSLSVFIILYVFSCLLFCFSFVMLL